MYDPPMEYPGASEFAQELESSEAAARQEREYRDSLDRASEKSKQKPESKEKG